MLGGVDDVGEVLDQCNVGRIQTRSIRAGIIGDRVLLQALDVGLIQAGRTDAKVGRIQLASHILVAEQFADSYICIIQSLNGFDQPHSI